VDDAAFEDLELHVLTLAFQIEGLKKNATTNKQGWRCRRWMSTSPSFLILESSLLKKITFLQQRIYCESSRVFPQYSLFDETV
jgi:hypothetical protein